MGFPGAREGSTIISRGSSGIMALSELSLMKWDIGRISFDRGKGGASENEPSPV